MWYAVLYGATGGHTSQEAAQKTDIAMACLVDELAEVADQPTCILGDLNADPDDIPTAWDLITNEGWKDLGDNAHIWGGVRAEATCQAPNTNTATRRDYIIANEKMFEKVRGFEVEGDDNFATHKPIAAKLEVDALHVEKKVLRKPTGAYELLQKEVDTNI